MLGFGSGLARWLITWPYRQRSLTFFRWGFLQQAIMDAHRRFDFIGNHGVGFQEFLAGIAPLPKQSVVVAIDRAFFLDKFDFCTDVENIAYLAVSLSHHVLNFCFIDMLVHFCIPSSKPP